MESTITGFLGLPEWLWGGIFTLAAAILGAVIWEGLLKPRRDRKRIAGLFAAEMLFNIEAMIAIQEARRLAPQKIGSDYRLTTLAWDASAQELSVLPKKIAGYLLKLYARFFELNRLLGSYEQEVNNYRLATTEVERKRSNWYMESIQRAYDGVLASTIAHADNLLGELHAAASLGDRPSIDVAGIRARLVERMRKPAESAIPDAEGTGNR